MNEKFYALPKEKQDKILNGALKIFSICNYKNASTIEIAKEADISKGLLFHYFTNKKELYLYLYDYCVKYVVSEMKRSHVDDERDFFKVLLNSQQCKCEMMKHHRYIFEFLVKVYFEDDVDIKEDIDKRNNNLLENSLSGVLSYVDLSKFKDNTDVSLLLKTIVWCSNGYMREKLCDPNIDIDKINTEFAQVLLMLRAQFYKEEYLNVL